MPNMSAILPGTSPARNPKLLDQVRDVLRRKHFSLRTEQAYVGWIRPFILFHAKRHPREMAEQEVTEFLTHLAREGLVLESCQKRSGAHVRLTRGAAEKSYVSGLPAARIRQFPSLLRRESSLKHKAKS